MSSTRPNNFLSEAQWARVERLRAVVKDHSEAEGDLDDLILDLIAMQKLLDDYELGGPAQQ